MGAALNHFKGPERRRDHGKCRAKVLVQICFSHRGLLIPIAEPSLVRKLSNQKLSWALEGPLMAQSCRSWMSAIFGRYREESGHLPKRSDSEAIVKVCGCRPHEGGATDTGAGVRKPPKEETAGGRERWSVRSYGNLVAGALLPKCIERVFGKRSRGQRTRSTDRDMQNWRCASEIEREDGCP